uniref:Ess-2 splicing factor homolog n=1 Tax=Sinocyclocheilus anshuiensis TaxID=1608454 RepID=A0A671KWC5_9TELE
MTESKEKALSLKSDVTTVAVRDHSLEKIIQRDFFQDVSKLQAQKDYLEAEEGGDLEQMREIAIKYGSAMAKYTPRTYVPYTTPSTVLLLETPDGGSASPSCSQSKHRATKEDGKEGEKAEEKDLPSLDHFLAKNMSEDNASFEQIMELVEDKDKLRHAWLYEAENEYNERHEQNLTLPSTEKQALECTKAGVETWQYKAKNALMYYPEGKSHTVNYDTLFKTPREVLYKNTRFNVDPFCKALNKSQIQQAAALNAQVTLTSASHFPGLVLSRPTLSSLLLLSFWSSSVGLETGEWRRCRALAFTPPASLRSHGSRLTLKGLSPAALSPALQRLVNRSSSKYTDKALRASYTPSPAHRIMGSKTPLGGPATPSITPTPGKARTPATQDPASITDNLLQLPKRRKASDYF